MRRWLEEGDERTLIKVKVRDIIEVNKAIVADISNEFLLPFYNL
jgi:hypothetical protein